MVIITPAEGALLIFLQSGVKKLLARLGIELTTLNLGSQSSACDHLVMATSCCIIKSLN